VICPNIVKIVHNASWGAYESRYAPYVPRDYADLAALQVLCGDVIIDRSGKIIFLTRLFDRKEFDKMKEVIFAELAQK